jgi:hypothetical protein
LRPDLSLKSGFLSANASPFSNLCFTQAMPSVQAILDEDKVIRGRLDFIVFKNQLWFAVIETKNAAISI